MLPASLLSLAILLVHRALMVQQPCKTLRNPLYNYENEDAVVQVVTYTTGTNSFHPKENK
jgi:hypothetical protein